MQLELSEEDAAFREEMRDFFTTKVPQEIRDTVAERRDLTKDQIVAVAADPQRRGARRAALARRVGRPGLDRRCSGTSGTRRCSAPACRPRWRSTPR